MRKYRFATERKNLRVGSSVKLEEFEAAHALRTLRLKKEDEIFLFNGEKEFKAVLKLVSKDAVMAEIVQEAKVLERDSLNIDVYIGLSRTNTLEEVMEKLTELGVKNFIPVECEYSIIKNDHIKNKYERWNKIILSACKQSERIDIPEIQEGVTFKDSIDISKSEGYDKIFFMTLRNRGDNESWEVKDIATLPKEKLNKIGVFVGPEGGFSPNEHKLANENGIEFIQIFDSVLRVETAAISAVTIVKYLHG